jgi:serine/threonine-protein kinase
MLLGSYEVLLCVARGGMACVWAARRHGARGFNRLVALKTVLPELAEPEFESMFLDEAKVAARIHHPNVCEIYELVEHSGVLALSMEWVDGDTLNAVLNSREPAPLDRRVAAQIVAHVASGLHAAHELRDENGAPMGLVHRDVSPQNILISSDGHVKIADFGVAKALGGNQEETAIGRVKGKLSYMSPEQAEAKPLDRRSDVFALGVVLYVATVGVHPFKRPGDSQDDQLLRLLVGRFERPSAIVPGYPAELEAIVLRAMSREPAERFASADEMRCRLAEWIVSSGPLLTEQHIARTLRERVGKAIDTRTDRIQRCITASQQIKKNKLEPGVVTDVTFVPTTRGVTGSITAASIIAPRRIGRAIAAAVAAVAVGVAGTLSLTGDSDDVASKSPEPSTPARAGAAAQPEPAPREEHAVAPSADRSPGVLPAASKTAAPSARTTSAPAPSRPPAPPRSEMARRMELALTGRSPARPATAERTPSPAPSRDR